MMTDRKDGETLQTASPSTILPTTSDGYIRAASASRPPTSGQLQPPALQQHVLLHHQTSSNASAEQEHQHDRNQTEHPSINNQKDSKNHQGIRRGQVRTREEPGAILYVSDRTKSATGTSRGTATASSPSLPTKAYQTAVFYSECHLSGITPEYAEKAVEKVDKQYRKWWIDALRSRRRSSEKPGRKGTGSSDNLNTGRSAATRARSNSGGRLSYDDGDSSQSSTTDLSRQDRFAKKFRHTSSSNVGDPEKRKRRNWRQRKGRDTVREVIARVTQRQDEQGGGYLSPITVPAMDHQTSTSDAPKIAPVVSSAATSAAPTTDEDTNNESDLCSATGNGMDSEQEFAALSLSSAPPDQVRREAMQAKSAVLSSLASTGGDVKHPTFLSALDILKDYYRSSGVDARDSLARQSSHTSNETVASFSPQFGQTEGLTGSFEPHKSDSSTGSSHQPPLEGTWLSLSRPDYRHCLGRNAQKHYCYTLGRMAFDMFRPTELKCSIQGEFNTVTSLDGTCISTDENVDTMDLLPEYVPRRLRKEVQVLRKHRSGEDKDAHTRGALSTYNIVVAFVIENDQDRHGNSLPLKSQDSEDNESGTSNVAGNGTVLEPSEHNPHSRSHQRKSQHRHKPVTRPIRGIMTNLGYMLPDPKTPNRLSIFFTEGSLEVNDEEADLDEWKKIFEGSNSNSVIPRRALRERAHRLAAKLFLGADMPDQMEEDGTMRYELKRPIGGHGLAYCDVLYLDDDLRILRGHHGQVYVCSRVLTGQSAASLQAVSEEKVGKASNGNGASNGASSMAYQVSA